MTTVGQAGNFLSLLKVLCSLSTCGATSFDDSYCAMSQSATPKMAIHLSRDSPKMAVTPRWQFAQHGNHPNMAIVEQNGDRTADKEQAMEEHGGECT